MDVSVVSVVCCQVQVSATSWSLVHISPAECGVVCRMWSRKNKPLEGGGQDPTGGYRAKKKISTLKSLCWKPWRTEGVATHQETQSHHTPEKIKKKNYHLPMQVIKILQTRNSKCWSLRNLLVTTMKTYTPTKTQAASENCLFSTWRSTSLAKNSISLSQWQHLQ